MTNCPLCNRKFDENTEDCHTGCYMSNGCPLIKCPHCGYEFVTESKTVNFLKRVFGRKENDRDTKLD